MEKRVYIESQMLRPEDLARRASVRRDAQEIHRTRDTLNAVVWPLWFIDE